jgi:hypothetical protein
VTLKWEDHPDGIKADHDGGAYHISHADSIGSHEIVYFRGHEYYVGYVFGEREAKAKAQAHADWIDGIKKDRP